jgi:myo-inositol-1(or 4)-monophosphatase
VAEAGERLRLAWRESKVIQYKGPVDLVTDTDRELEALVVSRLQREFPQHRIVAEEGTASGADQGRRSQYVWYLDPLDGTTNFAHAYPHFAVSLAFARGAELEFGIVHEPIRRETFVARHGGGATLNGEAIRVSAVGDLNRALLGTGFPYDRREHLEFYLSFLGDFMLRAQGVRRSGAASLDLCYVACGRLDGFWEWKLSPWDTAAGALIVREAGGVVTDFRGGTFDLFGQQTFASNGRLHAAMGAVLVNRLGA